MPENILDYGKVVIESKNKAPLTMINPKTSKDNLSGTNRSLPKSTKNLKNNISRVKGREKANLPNLTSTQTSSFSIQNNKENRSQKDFFKDDVMQIAPSSTTSATSATSGAANKSIPKQYKVSTSQNKEVKTRENTKIEQAPTESEGNFIYSLCTELKSYRCI